MLRYSHSGDAGDVIASLPVIRALGGGDLILHQGKNPRPFRPLAAMLLRLLKSQPYIKYAAWEDRPAGINHDFGLFRTHYKPTRTLTESQGSYVGLPNPDLSPWLTGIPPDPRSKGVIVIGRTQRYTNPKFPWRHVLSKFRNRIFFIGTDPERHQLERIVGFALHHQRIKDFWEAASIIAGADCLIANQSSLGWLAMGMGTPLVQETENTRKIHDSMVPRSNTIYCTEGVLDLDNLPKGRHQVVLDYQI